MVISVQTVELIANPVTLGQTNACYVVKIQYFKRMAYASV